MSDDDDFNFSRFRWVLAFGIIFACSLVYSLFDIAFLLFAREGTATVVRGAEYTGRRSDSTIIEYTFKEPDGHEREGRANLGDVGDPPPAGTEFEIQYLPRWLLDAPDASRPTRSFSWITLTILLFTSAGFGFFTYRAIFQPDGAAPRKPPSRKR